MLTWMNASRGQALAKCIANAPPHPQQARPKHLTVQSTAATTLTIHWEHRTCKAIRTGALCLLSVTTRRELEQHTMSCFLSEETKLNTTKTQPTNVLLKTIGTNMYSLWTAGLGCVPFALSQRGFQRQHQRASVEMQVFHKHIG